MRTPSYMFLILFGVGIYSVYLGISGTLGYRRLTYIFPMYYSGGINYASIPMGIMAIIWAFAFGLIVTDEVGLVLTYISLAFGLLGMVFNFIQPAFLTPQWYRWLKETHGDIMPWLRQDARHMGYSKWKKRTKTIAELEDWAIDVRKRYRQEIEVVEKQEGFPL